MQSQQYIYNIARLFDLRFLVFRAPIPQLPHVAFIQRNFWTSVLAVSKGFRSEARLHKAKKLYKVEIPQTQILHPRLL